MKKCLIQYPLRLFPAPASLSNYLSADTLGKNSSTISYLSHLSYCNVCKPKPTKMDPLQGLPVDPMDQETAQPRCPHRRAKSERSSLETTFYCYLQCFRPKMPCEENCPKRAKSSQAAFAQNAIRIHRNRCRRLFLRIGPSVGIPATSAHSGIYRALIAAKVST